MNRKHQAGKGILWGALALIVGLSSMDATAQVTYTYTGGFDISTPENWDPNGLPINGNIGEITGFTARIFDNMYTAPDTAPLELRVFTGGEILLGGNISENHNIVLDGGKFGGAGASWSYAGSTFVKSDSTITGMNLLGTLADYDGSNTGRLTYGNTGRLSLEGDNSAFTGGFNIANGSIDLRAANALGTGPLEFTENANTKDLNIGGFDTTVTRLSGGAGTGTALIQNDPWDTIGGPSTKYNDATLTVDQDVDTTYSGTFQHATKTSFRALNLVKTGTGILTLTGASSTAWDNVADSKTISEGTLVVGHADALGTGGTITVNNGGTLAIADGITFTQQVTFDSGSTLGGNGTYGPSGGLTVVDGMTVAPGMSIGALTIESDVSFADGSVLEIELGNGIGDVLVVNGELTISIGGATGTTLLLNNGGYSETPILTFTSGSAAFDWVIYNGEAAVSWQDAQESQAFDNSYNIQLDGNSVFVIPEPSTFALLLLSGVVCYIAAVGRKRK
ncbi:MAG: PEP-CTERM sorting domain-containing protein [Kiritimatiellia bacterium]